MEIGTMWLTTNRTCNNRCSWCYAQNNKQSSAMDYSTACHLVDVASELNVNRIVLIGGEPTLYPYLCDLIRYIRTKNIIISIATNGRLLSNAAYLEELVRAGADRFGISLKATSEDEYMFLTGRNGFRECLTGYRNVKALGLNANLSYVIVNDSASNIDKIFRIVKIYGIEDFTFQFVKPVVEKGSEALMSLKSMGKVVSYIYNKISSEDVDCTFKFEISFPLCLIDKDTLSSMIRSHCFYSCCHIQKGTGLIFDTNARILPCNHFVDLPFVNDSFGFCTTAQLNSLWNSDSVLSFRKVTKTYPSSKCLKCKIWSICGGGCFTRWLFLDPEYEIEGFSDDGASLRSTIDET